MPRWLLAGIALIAIPFAAPFAAYADRTTDLLRALSDAPGISGREEAVRKIMRDEMAPLADAPLRYDGLGSVIAVQGRGGPRIMVDAHMDEIGGTVRSIDAGGFITLQQIGGWVDNSLVGQRWVIHGAKGPVAAVSNVTDRHLVEPGDVSGPLRALFLDTGARSAAEVAELGIRPGDPIVPDSKFEVMASGRYLGKAFDDRVGCAVMIEVMKRLKTSAHANQVFYAATVQEEVGIRGAYTAVAVAKPDIAIVLEGGVVSDTPDPRTRLTNGKLGGGPQLFFYDATMLPDPKLAELVRTVAAEKHIPLQSDLVVGYGQDGGAIQRSGIGVPTINITVPLRYTHAHAGILDRGDFDRTVDLLVALLQRLDQRTADGLTDFSRR